MTVFSRNSLAFVSLILAVSIAARVASAASSPAPKTLVGSAMPMAAADSVTGKHVALPADAAGHPFALVIATDRAGADSLQAWSHALAKRVPSTEVYAVVVAAGAPFFAHGMIRKKLDGDASAFAPMPEANILVSFSDDAWHDIAPAGKKEDAAIVIVSANGTIVAVYRSAFSEDAASTYAREFPAQP